MSGRRATLGHTEGARLAMLVGWGAGSPGFRLGEAVGLSQGLASWRTRQDRRMRDKRKLTSPDLGQGLDLRGWGG